MSQPLPSMHRPKFECPTSRYKTADAPFLTSYLCSPAHMFAYQRASTHETLQAPTLCTQSWSTSPDDCALGNPGVAGRNGTAGDFLSRGAHPLYEHGPCYLGDVCDRELLLSRPAADGAALKHQGDCRNATTGSNLVVYARCPAGAARWRRIFLAHHLKAVVLIIAAQQPSGFCVARWRGSSANTLRIRFVQLCRGMMVHLRCGYNLVALAPSERSCPCMSVPGSHVLNQSMDLIAARNRLGRRPAVPRGAHNLGISVGCPDWAFSPSPASRRPGQSMSLMLDRYCLRAWRSPASVVSSRRHCRMCGWPSSVGMLAHP